MFQQQLSVEQLVALNLGDEDWYEIDDYVSSGDVLAPGCSRATPEVDVSTTTH